ncbi:MAG: DUF4230 domain-containing protein [Chryseobacterium sp.]|nr:MAG: DUF4230 domain-containing protein [Chryseobacterium sp.]
MQRRNYFPLLTFLLGIVLAVIFFFAWKGLKDDKADVINQDYYLLTNQISKMNKMLVVEQDFSSFQTHKSAAIKIAGFNVLPKEMILLTTAKAQVTYDMKQVKIDVDTLNKKLIIQRIPNAEIKIYPDVKIHFMDDYALNRFDQKSINGIMESAKRNMRKSIDQKKLQKEGREQLVKNLNDIFVLAKALDYEIVDNTGRIGPVPL